MVGSYINDDQLRRIVAQTMEEVSGQERATAITYEQFREAFKDADWKKIMSVRF